jgi:hypothetical protein
MTNQTRANEGRGLAVAFGVGCVNSQNIAATSPATQARTKRATSCTVARSSTTSAPDARRAARGGGQAQARRWGRVMSATSSNYVLAEIRCAELRVRIAVNEIQFAEVALKAGSIDADAVMEHLAEVGVLDLIDMDLIEASS